MTAKLSPFHDLFVKTEPPRVHYHRQGKKLQHRLNLCFSAQRSTHRLHHLNIVLGSEMRLVLVTIEAEE